jgi:hypothetical protein
MKSMKKKSNLIKSPQLPQPSQSAQSSHKPAIKIIPLDGLGYVGKNMTL